MALYKTHTKFNLILLPILIIAIYKLFHPATSSIYIFSSFFVYSTLFMNPDMDVSNQIKLFSLKGFFTLPFRFYSIIFKHRGISHSLFWGTLTRVLFLAAFFISILLIFNFSIPTKTDIIKFYFNYKPFILYGFFGIFLADICHLLLDIK